MNSQPKPLNVPLIAFTLVVVILGETTGRLVQPTYHSAPFALLIGVITLMLSPLFILWTRALWNTLVPRITGWRDITFWEAAGLTALLAFLV